MKRMKRKIILLLSMLLMAGLFSVPALAEDVALDAQIYDNILTLENKNTSTWQVIQDGISGALGYNDSGSEFVFGLTAQGLADGDYALIYYADFTGDKYGDWGGDNPGAIIATTTSTGGNLSTSGSIELNMDLPCPPDANQFEHDYSGDPDNYDNAHGAKVWLVPTSALTSGNALPVTAWPPNNNWLFETNLIWYDDTDVESTIAAITVEPTSINFGILTPGQTGGGGTITITNSGNCPIMVEASVTTDTIFESLQLDGGSVGDFNLNLQMGEHADVAVTLPVPSSYTPHGSESGTLIFEVYTQ